MKKKQKISETIRIQRQLCCYCYCLELLKVLLNQYRCKTGSVFGPFYERVVIVYYYDAGILVFGLMEDIRLSVFQMQKSLQICRENRVCGTARISEVPVILIGSQDCFSMMDVTIIFVLSLKCSSHRCSQQAGTFGIFLYPVCRKIQKKLKGDPLGKIFFPKKSLAMPKKTERGDPLVSPGIVCYAGNFLVLFPGPTGEIWNFVELLVELFWSVQVVLKKWRKAMTIVDSFL